MHPASRTTGMRAAMRAARRVFAALVALLLLVASSPAEADDADAMEVQRVIADQIAAFGRDDAELAYSHAAPSIQMRFRTPGIFMRMVEDGYEPVFRPRSYAFTEFRGEGGEAVQALEIVGPDGAPWIAVYTLEKQPDGAWRITGCYLRPGTGA